MLTLPNPAYAQSSTLTFWKAKQSPAGLGAALDFRLPMYQVGGSSVSTTVTLSALSSYLRLG